MLEAFFTRQRKRNSLILIVAIGLTITVGSHTPTTALSPQALQAVNATDVNTTDSVAPSSSRSFKTVQPVDTSTATTGSAPAPTPETSVTSPPAAATTAPAIILSQGKIERQEMIDSITYVMHFSLSGLSDTAKPAIRTKLVADIACDKGGSDQTIAYIAQADLTVSCTYAKTTWQTLASDISFRLDVNADGVTGSSLTYHAAR